VTTDRDTRKHVMWWKHRKKSENRRELRILLDKDSFDRFNRLKARIPAFDSTKIMAAALKCLEQKTDRIIKRQIRIRFRVLEKEGHNPQQIAAYLKKEGYGPQQITVCLKNEGHSRIGEKNS
jgi:hypothetical protein